MTAWLLGFAVIVGVVVVLNSLIATTSGYEASSFQKFVAAITCISLFGYWICRWSLWIGQAILLGAR